MERLALKKSANNEVFEHIKSAFDEVLKSKKFKDINEAENFTDANGKVENYRPLDTSIEKLRVRYKGLKKEWREVTQRAKSGSGLASESEPVWFQFLDHIFTETNEDVALFSAAADTSFVNDAQDSNGDVVEDTEENFEDEVTRDDDGEDIEENEDDSLTLQNLVARNSGKRKMTVAPHKKATQVRSNKQALSEMARNIKLMSDAQTKRHKQQMEVENSRFELLIKEKREEAERNRQHELKIAEIFANAMAMVGQQRQQQQYTMPSVQQSPSAMFNLPPVTPIQMRRPSQQQTGQQHFAGSGSNMEETFSHMTGYDYQQSN